MLVAGTPSRAIAYLDGVRLHRALTAGIHRVLTRQEELNRINVFPVADADTGTNLAATLRAVLEATGGRANPHAGTLLGTVAESALDGARGNSGAIFAQFLQGVAERARRLGRLDAERFSDAVKEGARSAREALSEPREGTILTVIAAFSDELANRIRGGLRDFSALLHEAQKRARDALVETQHQLPQLERAGVVDAGALGFVEFLEGILSFIREGNLRELDAEVPPVVEERGAAVGCEGEFDTPSFRFCTECVVGGENIDRQRLRAELGALRGDSLVVAGSAGKVRVHCHVDNPGELFLACERFGAVTGQKADDMLRQLHAAHTRTGVAVVTDSGADLPAEALERLDIHVVPLRLQVNGRDYLDKVTLNPREFYDALRGGAEPTTSQPPPGDFRRHFNFLGSHYESVLAITLSSALSGTWQATHSAAERTDHENVTVFDTHNAAAGQGLLVMYAAECAAAGWDVARTVGALQRLAPQTRTFAVIRDLSFGVRGGRVPQWFKWLADGLRLTPILANDQQGRIKLKGVIPGRTNLARRLAGRVGRRLDPGRAWRVLVGHCDCEAEGRALQRALVERIPHVHSAYLTDAGTAIGAHAGPGSLVVGVQPYEPPERAETRALKDE